MAIDSRADLPEQPPDEDYDDDSEDINPRDVWTIVRFLGPYSRPYRSALLLLGGILFIETLINFSFPLATQYLIDDGLLGDRDFNVLVGALIFIAAGALGTTLLGVALDYFNAKIFTSMTKDIREKLFAHVQTLSMPYFTRTHAGELLSRFSGDTVALEGTLTTMVPWLLVPLAEVIYSVVLMFYFNVWLGLIACLVFPLTLIVPRLFANWTFTLGYEKRKREAEVMGAAQENVSAQAVVKAFGLEPPMRARFGFLNLLWQAIAFRFHFFGALIERSCNTGVYIIHFVIFALGAYWVYSDRISMGSFVALETTFLSMGYALTYVTQYVPMLAQGSGSINHLNDIYAVAPQVEDAPNAAALPRLDREVAFEGVSFHYAEDSFALKKVDLRIPKGAFTALVGGSGSGKSTVLNLLLRLYDPTEGAVTIDGRDIRSVTQESLRRQIGMVFQDNYLFNATVLENIRMGFAGATQEQVESAARAAEIHDFIVSLPEGYNTIVGERGSQLSGGQRQRLAIARALVRDPAILILDEATSALDYTTEAALNQTLMKVAEARTVIMVTHRLSSVVSAANIIVLDKGQVVESGTHEELRKRKGAYAALWRDQLLHAAQDAVADQCDTASDRAAAEELDLV